jgi:hypothetical protein
VTLNISENSIGDPETRILQIFYHNPDAGNQIEKIFHTAPNIKVRMRYSGKVTLTLTFQKGSFTKSFVKELIVEVSSGKPLIDYFNIRLSRNSESLYYIYVDVKGNAKGEKLTEISMGTSLDSLSLIAQESSFAQKITFPPTFNPQSDFLLQNAPIGFSPYENVSYYYRYLVSNSKGVRLGPVQRVKKDLTTYSRFSGPIVTQNGTNSAQVSTSYIVSRSYSSSVKARLSLDSLFGSNVRYTNLTVTGSSVIGGWDNLEPNRKYFYQVIDSSFSFGKPISKYFSEVYSFQISSVFNPGLLFNFDNGAIPGGWSGDWVISSGTFFSAPHSLGSSSIPSSSSTSIQFSYSLNLPGKISFYRQVSSEGGYDFLIFYIDGQEKDRWSGTGNSWTQFSYDVSPGSHIYRWTYSKDGSQTAGSDRAWIDDVRVRIN